MGHKYIPQAGACGIKTVDDPLPVGKAWVATAGSSVDYSVPTVGVGLLAELNGAEAVVEAGGDRAGLAILGHDIFHVEIEVVDLGNRRRHGGSATSGGFLNLCELLHWYVAALHFDAHILGESHEAIVCHRGENRFACRGDIHAILDCKEVGGATLVDIFLLLGVEIEHSRVAEFVGFLAASIDAA